jgi:hypothetical protein
MNAPRLSIITITKDDPTGLARTLQSTGRWRALPEVEHLVVYGGADPEVAAADLRLQRETSAGIAAAFNQGLALAHGVWVWFVNGGDAVHEALDPTWLLALLANSRADMVVGGIHYDGDASPRPFPPLHRQWPLLECWLPHPATLVKKQTLLQAGGFDTGYTIAMDYDLWFRLLNGNATVDVISVPLARFNPTGLSQRADYRQVVCREEARVIQRNWRSLLGAPLGLSGRVIRRLMWSIRHRNNGSQQPPTHGQQ